MLVRAQVSSVGSNMPGRATLRPLNIARTVVIDGDNPIYTANDITAGIIVRTEASGASADVLPAPAEIYAANPELQTDDTFQVLISNQSGQNITLDHDTNLGWDVDPATIGDTIADGKIGFLQIRAQHSATSKRVLQGSTTAGSPVISGIDPNLLQDIPAKMTVLADGGNMGGFVIAVNPNAGTITVSENAPFTSAKADVLLYPAMEYFMYAIK